MMPAPSSSALFWMLYLPAALLFRACYERRIPQSLLNREGSEMFRSIQKRAESGVAFKMRGQSLWTDAQQPASSAGQRGADGGEGENAPAGHTYHGDFGHRHSQPLQIAA